jgi:hypothetical protein
MKLTTHLHPMQRSKNEWSYTSTPRLAFMVWCLVRIKGTGTNRIIVTARGSTTDGNGRGEREDRASPSLY